MLNFVRRIVAASALAFIASSATAATFTQVGPVDPGQIVEFDVDLELPIGFELGAWSLTLSPAPGTALLGIIDNSLLPVAGGTPPLYQVISNPTTAPALIATGSGAAFFTSFDPTTILATSSVFPIDNLSMFRLGFGVQSSVPDNSTLSIGYSSFLSVRDASTGLVNNSAFEESGTFTIQIGEVIAPVPLPAGGALMLGGLGALAFLRRKIRMA